MALDSSGAAYVIGWTKSTDFPTVNPIQSSLGGTQNAFVTKLNATGSALVYSTYLGGNCQFGLDIGIGITVDSSGNAYVVGQAGSSNFPLVNAVQTNAGRVNAFVAEINAAGSALVFSTYLGGSTNQNAFTVAVDSSGAIYVGGDAVSADFPVTANALQPTFGGSLTPL